MIDATARGKNCDKPPALKAQCPSPLSCPCERHVSRIGRLTAFCLLVAAVVTIGLAIGGALKEARSPVPQLASQK